MLALREFRATAKGLPDLLNYAAVVDDGVVLNKDGSLTAAWTYRGEDLDSASPAELASLSARVNAAFARRGSGWMLHVDALRTEARGYPDAGAFPDRTTLLIDRERLVRRCTCVELRVPNRRRRPDAVDEDERRPVRAGIPGGGRRAIGRTRLQRFDHTAWLRLRFTKASISSSGRALRI